MAGVKGRSGGARAGAGRPPKQPVVTAVLDPLEFLRKVWSGEIEANASQVRAASAALPFVHQKLGEGGKKDAKDQAAQKAVSKFAPTAAPLKLVSR